MRMSIYKINAKRNIFVHMLEICIPADISLLLYSYEYLC